MKHIINLLSEFIGFLALVGVVAFMGCLSDPEKAFTAILSTPEAAINLYLYLFVGCSVVLGFLCVVVYFIRKDR